MYTVMDTHSSQKNIDNILHIPFSLSITPMKALLFITFEQDPDSVYSAFEVQRFDDNQHGTGQLIIGWRVDGKVDIFHEPQLKLDPDGYDVCKGGLANIVSRDFNQSYFLVRDFGLEAHYSFEDINGRLIEFTIIERNKKTPRPFGFLAPVGDGSEDPSAMPILMLHDFYFVRRKETEILININGRSHRPDVINFPIDWKIMYFTRYTPDPLVMFFNKNYEGPISALSVNGETEVIDDDTVYEIEYICEVPSLKAIKYKTKERIVRLSFDPAFPNLSAFNGSKMKGEFSIKGDLSLGEIRGDYKVTGIDHKLSVTMVPSGGWIPKKERIGIRLLYDLVGLFKNWPKSYMWTSLINQTKDGQLHMNSFWERMGKS
jgi:hypothetical protein